MSSGIIVGHVDRAFAQKGCVSIRVQRPFRSGDRLHFDRTDVDERSPVYYDKKLVITSVQIDHQSVDGVKRGDHCAVRIPGGALPPHGTVVLLVPPIEVGQVTRNYSGIRCVVIQTTEGGFSRGDVLQYGEGEDAVRHKANSVEIGHHKVDSVEVGMLCGVHVPNGSLPPVDTPVFKVG